MGLILHTHVSPLPQPQARDNKRKGVKLQSTSAKKGLLISSLKHCSKMAETTSLRNELDLLLSDPINFYHVALERSGK